MAGRVFWLLAVVLVLSGCVSRDAARGDEGADGADNEDDDAAGPFLGIAPGVQTLPLPANATGFASGVVYDISTGQPVADAVLTATCTGPSGLTLTETQVPIGEHGAFTLAGLGTFAVCSEVRYRVDAAGFDMASPLSSGGLVAGVHHVIYGGLIPA